MDADAVTRIAEIEESIDWCCGINGDAPCYHCRDKEDLINLACAWAFDLGLSGG